MLAEARSKDDHPPFVAPPSNDPEERSKDHCLEEVPSESGGGAGRAGAPPAPPVLEEVPSEEDLLSNESTPCNQTGSGEAEVRSTDEVLEELPTKEELRVSLVRTGDEPEGVDCTSGVSLRTEDGARSKQELSSGSSPVRPRLTRSEEEVRSTAGHLEELRSNGTRDEALGELPLNEDQLRVKAEELRVQGELRSEADLRSEAGGLEELRSKEKKLGEVRREEELRTKDDERSKQELLTTMSRGSQPSHLGSHLVARSEAEEAELRSKAEALHTNEEELEAQRSKEELRSEAEELRSKAVSLGRTGDEPDGELQPKEEPRSKKEKAEELWSREEELRFEKAKLEELRSKAEDLRLRDALLDLDSHLAT